ncbi:MAG: ABC transporter substrate-binding protein [Kineothrix sp.]|nr:ABC transporter substrate-binding protein [Kineothrix sp.]
MKRVMAMIMAACMMVCILAGCGTSDAPAENKGDAPAEAAEETKEDAPEAAAEDTAEAGTETDGLTPSGETLIVGTMANSLGLPVHQAEKAGYFKDAGLDVKIEIFATGAPINEAMAAGELDVAVSGMASVYALATGMYTYIGDGVITTGGESIYARADSPYVQAGADESGVIGNAEVLKDASILGPLATTAHYQAIKYMEHFGLTTDDFSMVSMDYPQAYQAFITGEGDLIANKMPYTNQLEEAGYVKVSDMNMILDNPIIDTIFVQNAVAEGRRDDLVLFLECYYKACADLMADEAARRDTAMEWYAEEGITYSDSDMDTEIEVKDYFTIDTVDTEANSIGSFMTDIGAFYVEQDMISTSDIPNVEASIDHSFLEAAKARAAK